MTEEKPMLYPLFSKLVYTKNININTKKILSLVKKEKFKIAGAKDSVSNHAQSSVCNTLLDKKEYKFLAASFKFDLYFNEYELISLISK